MYASRVMKVEHATFAPLVFTTNGGMTKESSIYHTRLAELSTMKQGEDYATTMSWISTKVYFATVRSALLCLKGSGKARKVNNNLHNLD